MMDTTRGKVLFMTSAVNLLIMKDGSHFPTGYWTKELRTTYRVFRDAGYEVDFATPRGRRAVADERSLQGEDLARPDEMQRRLERPLALEEVDPDEYAAVFIPGGHGPLQDLAPEPAAGRLLTRMHELGRPIGAICHGPAALLAAKRQDGSATFAGYRMTGYTDQEEDQSGVAANMCRLVQDSLESMGAGFVPGAPFEAHVETDRELHTGQNGQSSAQIGASMVAALGSPAS